MVTSGGDVPELEQLYASQEWRAWELSGGVKSNSARGEHKVNSNCKWKWCEVSWQTWCTDHHRDRGPSCGDAETFGYSVQCEPISRIPKPDGLLPELSGALTVQQLPNHKPMCSPRLALVARAKRRAAQGPELPVSSWPALSSVSPTVA
jgi:hypothetical protein